MRNPRAKVASVLKIAPPDFTARLAELNGYLDNNADQQEVDEQLARNALTVAVSDRVWNELKKAAGIV